MNDGLEGHTCSYSPGRKLLTLDELVAWLGVSTSWVYERTRRNAIPHVDVGRFLRFDADEIEAWLRSGDSGLQLGSLPEPESALSGRGR